MATAVLAATILYIGMPHRGRVPWLVSIPGAAAGPARAPDRPGPGRIDRRSAALHRLMLALLTIMTLGTVLGVVVLACGILDAAEGVTATILLGRGRHLGRQRDHLQPVVLADRPGGPAERAAGSPIPPSFAFPENATPELAPAGWRPAYLDYLYLAYTTRPRSVPPTPSQSGGGPS